MGEVGAGVEEGGGDGMRTYTKISQLAYGFVVLAEAADRARRAFVDAGKCIYATIERAYIEAHPGRRLPKATKARWQKKRQKIIYAWFERETRNMEAME